MGGTFLVVRHGSVAAPGTKAPVPRQTTVAEVDTLNAEFALPQVLSALGDVAVGEPGHDLSEDEIQLLLEDLNDLPTFDPELTTDEERRRERLWGFIETAKAVDLENRQGNPVWESAWHNLYTEIYPTVLKFVHLRRLGHRGAIDEEDWAMEAMTRGMDKIHLLKQGSGNPIGWFITLARNIRADHIKSHAFQRTHADGSLGTSYDEDDSPRTVAWAPGALEDDALESLWQTRQIELVEKAFEIMCKGRGTDQVAALKYQYWDDLSCREIGELMGKDEVSVRALLYRGRNTLRITIERLAAVDPEVATVVADLKDRTIQRRKRYNNPYDAE